MFRNLSQVVLLFDWQFIITLLDIPTLGVTLTNGFEFPLTFDINL